MPQFNDLSLTVAGNAETFSGKNREGSKSQWIYGNKSAVPTLNPVVTCNVNAPVRGAAFIEYRVQVPDFTLTSADLAAGIPAKYCEITIKRTSPEGLPQTVIDYAVSAALGLVSNSNVQNTLTSRVGWF